jgi:hypothetical protein
MNWDCPDGFFCLQAKDFTNFAILIATIFAIVYGAIKAVKIARKNDAENEQRKRRYEIFYNLMKTRRLVLMPEHIAALNLIQLEFYGNENVIQAYKKYIEHLNLPLPKDSNEHKKFFDDRNDRFYDLLHEVGRELGFAMDKRDLEKFSYAPQGWLNDDVEIHIFRRMMIELLSGHRPLPVQQFQFGGNNSKFPPPPSEGDAG